MLTTQTSALQQKFPLNKTRKFWKKIIQKSPFFIIIGLIVGFFSALFFWVVSDDVAGYGSYLGWGGAAALIVILVLSVIYGFYVQVYITRYYYDGNESFITIKKGVFAPTEIHVQYIKIQDVYVDQDILDRLIGIYDVHIASATFSSGIEAHIDGVDPEAAEGLKEFLLSKITGIANTSQVVKSSVNEKPAQQAIKPFEGKVTSDEYPIHNRWISLSIVNSVVRLVYLLVGLFFIFNDIFYSESSTSVNEDTQLNSLLFILILAGNFIFVIGSIIWVLIWRKNFRFELLSDYIQLHTAVVSREDKRVPYKTIQNVTLKQGVLERMFGLCTVVIENAAHAQGSNNTSAVKIPGQLLAQGTDLVQIVNKIIKTRAEPNQVGL